MKFYMLHISEFGKVCARFPEKAKEIVTGGINTIHSGSFVFIESTAEGNQGYFKDFFTNDFNVLFVSFSFSTLPRIPRVRISLLPAVKDFLVDLYLLRTNGLEFM